MKRIAIVSILLLVVCSALLVVSFSRKGRQARQAPAGLVAPGTAVVANITAEHGAVALTGADGIASTQITEQTVAFAGALQSGTKMLSPGLTNVSEELIAQVFKGLSDPTDVILVLDRYSNGDAGQRQIAKAFFQYMLKTYPEERLQACAHYMLGALEYVITDDGLRVDDAALARAVEQFEAVVALPSKQYWYSPALGLLAHNWMVVGRSDSDRRTAGFENSRRYYMQRYDYHESRGEHDAGDACLTSIFDALDGHAQCKAHFQQYKDRTFASPQSRQEFYDWAKFYGVDTQDKD